MSSKTLLRSVALSGLALALSSASALSFERMVDPYTLPPRERAFALHGPLGDRGPSGEPASPGCTWSRLQVPTSQGLRWMAVEDCDQEWNQF